DPYSIVPERDTSGHGTFLASIAAGYSRGENFSGAAPECGIIAVKLREARSFYRELFAVPEGAENVFESNAVIAGAEYIIGKARSLGMPAVICLGMGSNSGSHDGCGIFEEYLNSISKLRGVCVCVSAGNECRAHHHAAGSIPAAGMSSDISIKVEKGGNIYANIRNGASDKLSASVRSPTGELIGRVSSSPDLMITRKMVLEPSEISIGYYFPTECSSGQLTAVRITDATAGIWTITLYGDIILGGTYDAWLPITGLCGKGIEFLSSSPYGTVTVPATAQGMICCGAYDHLNGSLYLESSWGPSRTLSMLPDLTAPGVNISGIYPTGAGTMSGTSASAAITAGAAALMMQWGAVLGNDPSMSTHQIKAYLIRGCRRSDPISYPNTQWGYGTLDLAQSFDRLREI
ncbi:MAG: S8 family peptidase, partial [Oscillospiraceae bacterium]|nr:S8 family peptidase [Oscillospiraceae bacterium]